MDLEFPTECRGSWSLLSLVAELDLFMLTFLPAPTEFPNDSLLCSNFSKADFLFSAGALKSNFLLVLTGVVGQEEYPPRVS